MTIEEYLNKWIERIEDTVPEKDDCDGNVYLRGKRDAYREILEKLPSFDHDVTLREFKEFCRTHEQCSRCGVVGQCRFDQPRIWDLEEMERRMKYEEEKRMKEAKNGEGF